MNRKTWRLVAATALIAIASPAQGGGYLDAWHPHQTFWSVGWEVGIPVTGLRSGWVSNPSLMGGQFDVRVGVVGRLSAGIAGTWNWFDQNLSQVFIQTPDYAFTGPAYRRLSVFNLRGTTHYYLTSSTIQPYVGVGVGIVWTSTLRQTADRSQSVYSSYLAVDPEIGVLFNFTSQFAFYALGRYQWTAANVFDVSNAQWVGVQFGVASYF